MEKKWFLTPFFERKHTPYRCLNGDFQFQCSNRALLFDQKYKWHTFAVFFLIFVASVDPLLKNKSRIIIQKCWNFCKQLTLPDQTATSVFENCPVIYCAYWFVMVVRKNVLEYIIALVVVKNQVRLKKCLKKVQIWQSSIPQINLSITSLRLKPKII